MSQQHVHSTEETPGLTSSVGRRIFLIRHGVTEWNKKFQYQGITDIPLSNEGREQARLTGKRFLKIKTDRILSSPLQRSMETAEIVRAVSDGPSVEVCENLSEVNFGDWEGLTVRSIIERFGQDAFDAWRHSQVSTTATNGENAADVYMRAKRAADQISELEGENFIVVAHGAIFRTLLLHLIGLPKSNAFWRMRMDNCSISMVGIDKNDMRSVCFFNDTMHLKVPEKFIDILPL